MFVMVIASHVHQAFIVVVFFTRMFSHLVRITHVDVSRITSRAWGTLSLGVLLALILGLIARIPQSDIVLIAAIRCIGICSSTRAAGLLLLRVLLVTVRLLIGLLGWGEVRVVVVLALVIRGSTASAVLLLLWE